MTEKIQTEDEYREAVKRFLEICNIMNNPTISAELFRLIELLEEYENKNCF